MTLVQLPLIDLPPVLVCGGDCKELAVATVYVLDLPDGAPAKGFTVCQRHADYYGPCVEGGICRIKAL